MDTSQLQQITNEMIRLLEQLRRETEETQNHVRRGDKDSALRNTNAIRDEVQDLERKHRQLEQLLR